MVSYPERGIWSKEHAEKWEEGYVVGNGELGAILYGNPLTPKLVINHHTCYLKGNPMDTIPDLADEIPELRKIIQTEGYQKGIEFFETKALEKGYPGLTMSDVYHPAAQLDFSFPDLEQNTVSDYSRKLDYEEGLIQECFRIDGEQKIFTESFVSKDRNCLYARIHSNDSFDVSFGFNDFKQEALIQKTTEHADSLMQECTYKDGSHYSVPLKWKSINGNVTSEQNKISVKETKDLVFAVSFNKNTKSLNVEDFDAIKAEHISRHRNDYQSVSLDLVSQTERARSYEALIEDMVSTKEVPLVLYEKFYDASRYVIQSMSGQALPNLQGIWSGDFHPAWSGDFTFDTNVQLAIASYASLGWFEGFKGFFDQMEKYLDDFKENAEKYYGCRGYLVPVHASTRALHVHWNSEWPLIFWTAGAGWLAHFYQEYYVYTLDKEFLRETAVPFYIETLQFYEDFLMNEKNTVVLRPSYSAENGMGDTSTMDVAVIKDTIKNLTESLLVLGKELPERCTRLLNHLPDYLIDDEGVIKEWIDDRTVENHNHRHFSNLYPVFQSKEVTKDTPVLWEASQKAFDKRLQAWLLSEDGDTSSSHGRMHAAMCAVALERPDDVESALNALLINRSFNPSLVTSHYNQGEVFNVDANGSFPKVIHDSLVYVDRPGEITLFKATPQWLNKGTIKGMRLPSGITVEEMEWDLDDRYCKLTLVSSEPTDVIIKLQDNYRFKNGEGEFELSVSLKKDEPAILDLVYDYTKDKCYD